MKAKENALDDDALIAYFGYGSLVNIQTLQTDYVAHVPARLRGWCRHWQGRAEPLTTTKNVSGEVKNWQKRLYDHCEDFGIDISTDDIALLSVHRSRNTVIDGMLIIDRLSQLPSLDERERLYNRVEIDHSDIELLVPSEHFSAIAPERLFVYVGQPRTKDDSVLLQSYLDVVMSGFLSAHGEAALPHFLQTTLGFNRHVLLDRQKPIYPRAVKLEPELAHIFDRMLADVGVIFSGNA